MHIVLTVNAAWNVLNFRRPLVRALVEDGHRVTVLAPADGAEAELQAMGCGFVPLAMDVKGLSPLRDAALTLRLARHFRSLEPDAALGFTIKNNLFGALAARMTGTPFIPNVTGLGTAFLSGGALMKVAEGLYHTAFRGLPVVFFQNAEDRDLFLSRGLIKGFQPRLLPGSGIDLDRFRPAPLPDGGPAFLLIARLIRDKGVAEFVEAARLVRARHIAARFLLLGPLGAENRGAIPAAQLHDWVATGIVEYLGTATDVRPLIAAADCLVLPSYREGAPRTLIEGAAMARPAIASDVPGCRAVVEDGITGFLCAPRDGAALADACQKFIGLSAAERRRMGAAGRAKMEREYDEAFVVAAYRAALSEVAG